MKTKEIGNDRTRERRNEGTTALILPQPYSKTWIYFQECFCVLKNNQESVGVVRDSHCVHDGVGGDWEWLGVVVWVRVAESLNVWVAVWVQLIVWTSVSEGVAVADVLQDTLQVGCRRDFVSNYGENVFCRKREGPKINTLQQI